MSPRQKIGLTAVSTAAIPALAHAHDGEHGSVILANIMHWLSSPSHSLFAVIGGVVVAGLLIRSVRKSRA